MSAEEPIPCPLPKLRASRRGSAATPPRHQHHHLHSCAAAPGPLQAGTEDPGGSQLHPKPAPACKEPLLPRKDLRNKEGMESSPSPLHYLFSSLHYVISSLLLLFFFFLLPKIAGNLKRQNPASHRSAAGIETKQGSEASTRQYSWCASAAP